MSKLRTFNIEFAYGVQENINDFMRRADLFQGQNTGIITEGVIKTESPLLFEEYKEVITKAFADNGGKLYSIKEVIS